MEFTKENIQAIQQDPEALLAVFEEINANIAAYKHENDIMKLERRIFKSSMEHNFLADNLELTYRDSRGVVKRINKSSLDGNNYNVYVLKG